MVKGKLLKTICTISLLVIITVSTFGCGKKPEVTMSSKDAPIKIGYSPWPGWYVWKIAEKKDLFKKHGINVKLVWFPVYSDSLEAFNTGKIDANSQTLSDTLTPLSKGIDGKIVLVNDNSAGGDGIVAKPQYNNVKDLKGKKVATELGTIDHMLMLTALDRNGMKETDVNYTNMAVNDAGPAFISGNLDAAVLWEPFLSKAVEEGKGHIIFSSKDTPGLVPDLLVANNKVLSTRRDDFKKIIEVWFDALDYWKNNPDDALKIMADAAGTSVEEYKKNVEGVKIFNMDDNLNAFTKKDDFTYLGFTGKKTGEFLKSVNMLGNVPDVEKALDPSILKEIKVNKK
ncbi:ABC transporter substrate-binding protein [Clostridium sp.]|uniref:ABC transporter substrate-binding protein n=1 Tax=Clostridium sp. TaxID=1506 RepID=UPI00359FCF29